MHMLFYSFANNDFVTFFFFLLAVKTNKMYVYFLAEQKLTADCSFIHILVVKLRV